MNRPRALKATLLCRKCRKRLPRAEFTMNSTTGRSQNKRRCNECTVARQRQSVQPRESKKWPPARIRKLAEMRANNLKYAEIGRRMGCTANAAIGAAHRWLNEKERVACPYRGKRKRTFSPLIRPMALPSEK